MAVDTPEITGHQRACYTQQDRDQAAAGIAARHQQLRYRTDDETDD